METLLTNKKFIKASTGLVGMLSIFLIVLVINEIRSSQYIGHGNQQPASITVSGKGEVMAVSDIATLSVNLSKDGVTSKEAQSLLNEQITKTVDYLKKQKIEDKDIKSEYGGLNPKYSYESVACFTYPCPQKDPKIVGYTATQSITIKVREVDNANEVRTGLATLGLTNISGPTFSIDNQDALNDQAREKAIIDAKEKAKVLAKQLHVRLGDIISFSENGGGYPMMYAKGAMMDSASVSSAPAPELPKGENKITSNVNIVYEIR
jgi:uncharacterized protein YggE